MKNISVILIDDNELLREGVKEIIDRQPDIEMIATFVNGKKSLAKICKLKPDVMLLDLSITNKNNIKFMQSIMRKSPETKVIVMDVVPIQKDILQYIEAGVSGFILKDTTKDFLIKTIRSVADEDKILPSNLTRSLFSQIVENEINQVETARLINKVAMTKQEQEIVLQIAGGMTNKDIAQKHNVSVAKVRGHVQNILEKMILNTQIQSAIFAPPDEEINTTADSNHSNGE